MSESHDAEKNYLLKDGLNVGDRVKTQYEKYPYPPVPVEYKGHGLSIVSNYTLAQYARTRKFHSPAGKRALVAGCGTGHELHLVAANNPGFEEIIGVDFSNRSIEIANERIEHHNLLNCKAYVADLLDSSTLPSGSFDFITSYGVLHHLEDPSLGLSNLSAQLAVDGVMGQMLYNKAGRWKLYQIRKALKQLGVESMPVSESIGFIREVLQNAAPGSLVYQVYSGDVNKNYYGYDENIVDNFLHPNDLPFEIGELPNFLEKSDLEFVGVADVGFQWNPENAVRPSCSNFYETFEKLSIIDRLSVIEGLNPTAHTQNIFWACHVGQMCANTCFSEDFFKSHSWLANPVFVRYAHVCEEEEVKCVGEEWERVVVTWPLFSTWNSKVTMPDFVINDLLAIFAIQPMSGLEFLEKCSALEIPKLMEWLRFMERFRMILCQ